MKLSVRKKILFMIVGVIIVFGFAAATSVFLYADNVLAKKQKKELQNYTTAQVEALDLYLNFTNDVLVQLAKNTELSSILNNFKPNNSPKVKNVLDSFNIKNSFSAIYVMDLSGKVISSTNPDLLDNNYSFRDYFVSSLSGRIGFELAVGVTTKQLGYYFSAPIYNPGGQLIAVIVMKQSPDFIEKIINDTRYDRDINVILTDANGVIIYSNEKDKIYNTIGYISPDKRDLLSKKSFPDLSGSMAYDQVLSDLGTLQAGIINNYSFYDKYDGEDEILTLSKVGEYPLYFITEQDADIYKMEIYYISLLLSLFVLSAALIADFIISIIIKRFTKPFDNFKDWVNKIESDDYDTRLDVKTGDEFENFAESLNRISAKLKKNQEEIESKIQEKTADLERINSFMVGRELQMIDLKKKLKDK